MGLLIKKEIIICISCLYLFIASCNYNNEEGLELKNWSYINTSNSALSSNNVYELKLDSKGNIWVNHFKDYVTKISPDLQITKYPVPFNDSVPFPHMFRAMAIDKLDRVWVGKMSDYPLFYLENNQWQKIYCNGHSTEFRSMAFDESNNLWLGTLPNGLFKMQGDSFANWNFFNSNIAGGEIFKIIVKNSHEVFIRTEISPPWIGTKTSISFFDGNTFTMLAGDGNDSLSLLYRGGKFCLKNNNTLAIAGKTGIYELFNGRFKKYGDNSIYREYGSLVFDIIYDDKTGYWIATQDGLYNYNLNKATHYNTSNSGLTDNYINSLIFDNNNNNLYIGTLNKGICIYHINN